MQRTHIKFNITPRISFTRNLQNNIQDANFLEIANTFRQNKNESPNISLLNELHEYRNRKTESFLSKFRFMLSQMH